MKRSDWIGAGLAATLAGALFFVWRCPHRKTSFPITRRGLTYITCTSCGFHRLYDIHVMRGYGPWANSLEKLTPEHPLAQAAGQ